MAAVLAFLAALPGALTAVEKILGMSVGIINRIFPPKSKGERAVDKHLDNVKKVKVSKLKKNEAIKAAKRGHTKNIEDIINNPR